MPAVFNPQSAHRRAVIVAGKRTPFVRAFTHFLTLDSIDLGVAATRGLLESTGIAPTEIDSIVWGGVILPSAAPNVGREIALDLRLPASVEAMTVTRACASGLQAVTLGAAAIERGEADVVIAGGSDSTSNAEVKMGQRFVHALAPLALGKRVGVKDYMSVLGQLFPLRETLPRKPKIAERSTGQVMGEAADEMATRNQVTRAAQDAFAVQSHHRAAAATEAGRFTAEIVPVPGPDGSIDQDTMIRADTSLEKLARLNPVFSEEGTVTAGNSSGLTDGASAVLLMSEEKAHALGFTPLAAFRSWSYVGVDPADQLLMGPALAMPKAIQRAGLTLDQIDQIEMHEAFSAQVLSVLAMLNSDVFGRERLGLSSSFGDIAPERINPFGGSLAFGHPFAATGARMVTTMAHALQEGEHRTALLGICAAGGLGAAAVLERV